MHVVSLLRSVLATLALSFGNMAWAGDIIHQPSPELAWKAALATTELLKNLNCTVGPSSPNKYCFTLDANSSIPGNPEWAVTNPTFKKINMGTMTSTGFNLSPFSLTAAAEPGAAVTRINFPEDLFGATAYFTDNIDLASYYCGNSAADVALPGGGTGKCYKGNAVFSRLMQVLNKTNSGTTKANRPLEINVSGHKYLFSDVTAGATAHLKFSDSAGIEFRDVTLQARTSTKPLLVFTNPMIAGILIQNPAPASPSTSPPAPIEKIKIKNLNIDWSYASNPNPDTTLFNNGTHFQGTITDAVNGCFGSASLVGAYGLTSSGIVKRGALGNTAVEAISSRSADNYFDLNFPGVFKSGLSDSSDSLRLFVDANTQTKTFCSSHIANLFADGQLINIFSNRMSRGVTIRAEFVDDLTIEGVTVISAPHMAITAKRAERIKLFNNFIGDKWEQKPHFSIRSDGIHLYGANDAILESNTMKALGDDSIALNGLAISSIKRIDVVAASTGTRKLKLSLCYEKEPGADFKYFKLNDRIALLTNRIAPLFSGVFISVGEVADDTLGCTSGAKARQMVVDTEIPFSDTTSVSDYLSATTAATVATDDGIAVLSNLTAAGSRYLVKDNTVFKGMGRGMWLQSPNGVVYRNTFSEMGFSPIKINVDKTPGVGNVLIWKNTFTTDSMDYMDNDPFKRGVVVILAPEDRVTYGNPASIAGALKSFKIFGRIAGYDNDFAGAGWSLITVRRAKWVQFWQSPQNTGSRGCGRRTGGSHVPVLQDTSTTAATSFQWTALHTSCTP